jgi:hypothetical protein
MVALPVLHTSNVAQVAPAQLPGMHTSVEASLLCLQHITVKVCIVGTSFVHPSVNLVMCITPCTDTTAALQRSSAYQDYVALSASGMVAACMRLKHPHLLHLSEGISTKSFTCVHLMCRWDAGCVDAAEVPAPAGWGHCSVSTHLELLWRGDLLVINA